MTTTGRGKVFRRKMWARVFYSGWIELRSTRKEAKAYNPSLGEMRIIPVLVTEIRAGRGGKRGRHGK